MPYLRTPLVQLTTEALELARLIRHADDIQWQSSPVIKPREDTTERAKGGHGDPTLGTVLDAPRLRLRRAIEVAESDITELTVTLRERRAALEAAIDGWTGANR